MCETFKWIKLLVVESQKDGLQIAVKISLGKWLWATRKLVKGRQKCKYLTYFEKLSRRSQKLNPFEGFAHGKNQLFLRSTLKWMKYMSSKFNYFAPNKNRNIP